MLIEFCPHTIYPACNSASLLEERGCQMMFSPLTVFLWLRRWFSSPEQAEPAGRQVREQGAFRDGMAGRRLQHSVWVACETRQDDYLSPCTLNYLHFPGKTPDFSKWKLHCPISHAVLRASLEFRKGHRAGSQ